MPFSNVSQTPVNLDPVRSTIKQIYANTGDVETTPAIISKIADARSDVKYSPKDQPVVDFANANLPPEKRPQFLSDNGVTAIPSVTPMSQVESDLRELTQARNQAAMSGANNDARKLSMVRQAYYDSLDASGDASLIAARKQFSNT